MIKQASVLALLAAALIGFTPVFNLVGCYPKDYDPSTPAINGPSQAQVDSAAQAAGQAASAVSSAVGYAVLGPMVDLGARLSVLIAAWFIARSYKGKK